MYCRFIPKNVSDACFVRGTTGWQTQRLEHFDEGHRAVERVYGDQIQCNTKEYALL